MEYLNVIAAAAASWIFGAIWYSSMSKHWMAAAGLTPETLNSKNYPAFVASFICALIVAGMMRHIFQWGSFEGLMMGLVGGLGLGLFIAGPWIVTNYMFAQRARNLILIDVTYAAVGSAIMGFVLMLF